MCVRARDSSYVCPSHMLNVDEVKPDSHLAQTYQHHPFGHSLWVLKNSKTEEGREKLLDGCLHNYHLD